MKDGFSCDLSEAAASNGPSQTQPQQSGSIDNSESAFDDDEGGLSAFDQSLEKLSHGLKTVCSFDTFLGLDLMDNAEDMVCELAPLKPSGWKSDNLKVQGGINKKASGGCKSLRASLDLGEVFQDLLDG